MALFESKSVVIALQSRNYSLYFRLCNADVTGRVLLVMEATQHLHTDESPSILSYDVILPERCLVLLERCSDSDKQVFPLADVTCFLSRESSDVVHVHVTENDGKKVTS